MVLFLGGAGNNIFTSFFGQKIIVVGSSDRRHCLVHDPVHSTTLQVYMCKGCRTVLDHVPGRPVRELTCTRQVRHVASPSIFGTVPHSEKNSSEGEECHIMLTRK